MLFKWSYFPIAILHFAGIVIANVEKVIFTAPEEFQELDHLASLYLDVLSRNLSSLRKSLPVAFSEPSDPHGLESWYLLDYLEPHRKYEVRICWPATQPTKFQLHEYTPIQLYNNLSLSASIAQFSEDKQESGEIALGVSTTGKKNKKRRLESSKRSQLFLHVFAAADYYTTNETLMKFPPPVDVDIILDPYIFSVLPESLLPTAIYILLIAIGSWFLSDYIWKWLRNFSQDRSSAEPHDKKKEDEKQHTE